ncbi:hypothetical protein SAMN04515617_10518 [Collimonas sp. OK242]|jgi:hypothetical protein|uniref:hypothetical protein n=1 Tax=Collimonas sp. OK242 TaxID=1798195 RepID=UPI00089B548E|nr:hypothetical protein [Collimonas sp. OK242]SDX58490.1 hypothetical protein SAMN04515617_10518 [Collimonas sp. OK242]
MMMIPRPTGPLRILNQTALHARLRFRCDGFPIWDTWIEAGSNLAVPNPNAGDIMVSTALVDPVTNVAYTVPSRISRKSVRLVAKMFFAAGAGSFSVDQEPFDQAGQVGLLNLTSTDLRFLFRFPDSPFSLSTVVAPQAEQILGFTTLDVSATVDGITSAATPIKSWSSDVVIGIDYQNGQKFPQMKISAHESNGL